MTDQNINCFISSKNKSSTEKASNWICNFPSGMIHADTNKGLKLNVMSFHIQNNFYNIKDYNNKFEILIYNNIEVLDTTVQMSITPGNYSVYEFQDFINSICSGYFELYYNHIRNKYSIISTYPDNTFTLYLRCLNSGIFFGCQNGVEVLIKDIFEELPYNCSMTSFDKIVVNALGLNVEKASVENLGYSDPLFEKSSILLWSSRSDVPINGMVKYDNTDSGNSFSYYLYDTDVNSFNIVLTDENGIELTEALDYTMLLQFTVYEKDKKELYFEIKQISEYLKQIYIFFMIALEYFSII